MRMGTRDMMHYRHLAVFVLGELPKVVHKPRIWRAFLKYAQADVRGWGDAAKGSVVWGEGPTLAVDDLEENEYYLLGPGKSGVSGMFRRAQPHKIWVDDDLAAEYERDHHRADAKRYLEATILHELVHWANHWTGDHSLLTVGPNGVSVPTHTPEGFEIEAYGRVLAHW